MNALSLDQASRPPQSVLNSMVATPTAALSNPSGGVDVPAARTQSTPSFAHGGLADHLARGGHRKEHRTMIKAHFSPRELDVMDVIQGSQKRHSKDGIRSYPHLEEILKNPHIRSHIHRHVTAHAHGGQVHPDMKHLYHVDAEHGRHGDTEVAYIGPHTRHLLDMWAGHQTHNPIDHAPEYFSLGNVFSGIGNALGGVGSTLWNGIKSVGSGIYNAGKGLLGAAAPMVQQALPALGQMAGSALGSRFGGAGEMIGNALGGVAGNLGSNLVGQLAPQQDEASAPYQQAATQGLNTMAQNLSSGQGLKEAALGGLSSYGGQLNNPAGNFMQTAANAYGQGDNAQSALGQGLSRIGSQVPGAAGNFMQGAGSAMGGGANPWQALMAGGRNVMSQFAPQGGGQQGASPQPFPQGFRGLSAAMLGGPQQNEQLPYYGPGY